MNPEALQNVEVPAEAPPAPVEVDIESGKANDVGVMPAAKPEGEPAPRSPLPRPQARIQTLTHERDNYRTEADRLRGELDQARRQAAEERAGREQAERDGMTQQVQRTKADVAAAEAAMRAAEEADDTQAKIDAHKRLARAVAEEADADAWAASQPKPGTQPPAAPATPPQQQRQQEVQPLSAPTQDFMTDNPWFSVVQIGSDGRPMRDRDGRPVSNPSFDEEMHDVAMLEHKKIMREVRLGSLKQDFVESPEYFQRISGKVAETFPDAFEEPSEEPAPRSRAPAMERGKQPVAPSNRQVPGAPAPKSSTKMRLDGEQAALVRSLVDNGTMIYPRSHPDAGKRGQKMSYEDAYVKYAREMQADQANR